MTSDEQKRKAAEAALDYLENERVIGVGTGSTVNHFIDALAGIKHRIDGAVSSSVASTKRLQTHVIPGLDLNTTGDLGIYVDGADESTRRSVPVHDLADYIHKLQEICAGYGRQMALYAHASVGVIHVRHPQPETG